MLALNNWLNKKVEKIKIDPEKLLKARRRGMREAGLENPGLFKPERVHKNKKVYERNPKHKKGNNWTD